MWTFPFLLTRFTDYRFYITEMKLSQWITIFLLRKTKNGLEKNLKEYCTKNSEKKNTVY